MRKFAILTSGLIFNVYCFSMSLQVLTEQRIFKTLEYELTRNESCDFSFYDFANFL